MSMGIPNARKWATHLLEDLTIEIGQRCLNSCRFCSSSASPTASVFLAPDLIISVLREAVDLGLESVAISGGEPILHPELPEIIQKTTELGLSIHLYTSGIYEHDHSADAFTDWGSLAESLSSVTFNVQSYCPEIHNFLTQQPLSHEMATKSLLAALESGCTVNAHIVPNHVNLETIEETIDWLRQLGVKQVSLLRLVQQGNARTHLAELRLSADQETALRSLLHRLCGRGCVNSMHVRLGTPFSSFVGQFGECHAGVSRLVVRADGSVFPCEALKCAAFGDFSLGRSQDISLKESLQRGRACMQTIARKSATEGCPAQCLSSSQCENSTQARTSDTSESPGAVRE